MANKHKKNDGFDGKLAAIKAGLKRKPGTTLSKLKNASPMNEVKTYVAKLARIPDLTDFVLSNPMPVRSELIKSVKRINYFSIDRELYWAASVIRLHNDIINSFIRFKCEFETAVIMGKYKNGIEILDKIERTCGHSLWAIENRIAILQESEGLEKQKEFTYSITKNSDYNVGVRFLTHYWSNRAEKNVSWHKFESNIAEFSDKNVDNRYGLTDYTVFKLNFFGNPELMTDFGRIMYQESNSPVIDRYLTLITILELDYLKNTKNISKNNYNVLDLLSNIDDPRLDLLRVCYGLKPPEVRSCVCNEIFDYYAIGEFEKCCIAAEKLLETDATNLDFIEVYLKSAYKSNRQQFFTVTDTLQKSILSSLYQVMVKNIGCYDSFATLIKIVQVYSSHSWSPQLFSYILKHYSEDIEYLSSIFVNLGAFRKSIGNPTLTKVLPPEVKKIYREKMTATFSTSVSVNTFNLLAENRVKCPTENGICREIGLMHSAKQHLINGSYELARSILIDLLYVDDYILRQSTFRYLSKCYIKMNKISDAVSTVVDAYLENEQVHTILPVKQLVQILGNKIPRECEGDINTTILYYIYLKHIGNDKAFMLSETSEDLFTFYGATRPANLINTTFDEIPKIKRIFFLSNICTFEVMDSSVAFSSTEEVERERIFVCQLLVQIDPEQEKVYSEEIKAITEKLYLSKLLRHIQQSKIYVNVDGVKKVIDKPLRESYCRYLSLLDELTDTGEAEYIIESNEDGSELSFPVNEKNNLFANMIIEIRNKFVSSNEYGLDGYLSVGIRHGILSGQIRGLLEHANLVTQKDIKTSFYRDPEYWNDQYSYLIDKSRIHIYSKLKEFSKKIDEIIDELNNKFIRIKTEQNDFPDGLFDFIITVGEYETLQNQIVKETTWDEFVNKVIDLLWEKLDKALNNIQKVFQQVIKNSICKLFDELLQQLNGVILEYSLSELSTVITTSCASTLYEIDRIASWFTRAKTEYTTDFSGEVPFQIASEIIRNIHPNKKFEPLVNFDKKIIFQGKHIVGLTNVIYLVYDNIAKHSTRTNTIPHCSIDINYDGEFIFIKTCNQIDESIDIEQEKTKLQKIKESFSHTKSIEKSAFERGSGLYKIAKILAIDLSSKPDIIFDISEDRVFSLEAKLHSKGMIV